SSASVCPIPIFLFLALAPLRHRDISLPRVSALRVSASLPRPFASSPHRCRPMPYSRSTENRRERVFPSPSSFPSVLCVLCSFEFVLLQSRMFASNLRTDHEASGCLLVDNCFIDDLISGCRIRSVDRLLITAQRRTQ